MASATKAVEQVPVTTFVDQEVIHLILSVDEAETLRLVLGCIGGHPETTRRGHTDAINAALRKADVCWLADTYPRNPRTGDAVKPYTGVICFQPE